MNGLLLFLTVASTLVLRTGDRIAVDGPVRTENGVVTFRSAGVLYSLDASEVDRVVDGAEAQPAAPKGEPERKWMHAPKKLKLSAEERKRRLEELEQNHSGVAAAPQPILEVMPPPPSPEEVAQQRNDENGWRAEARQHEEALRRANEEVQLLENRVNELQSQITSFVSLGYKSSQFSYQTTELVRTQERIPRAQLEVERAERLLAQFREDARRQGVLPGWLR